MLFSDTSEPNLDDPTFSKLSAKLLSLGSGGGAGHETRSLISEVNLQHEKDKRQVWLMQSYDAMSAKNTSPARNSLVQGYHSHLASE